MVVFNDVAIISMVGSSYIIILSGMGDDVPILGAVVTLFGGDGLLLFWMIFLGWFTLSTWSMWLSGHLVIWSSVLLVNSSPGQYGHMVV